MNLKTKPTKKPKISKEIDEQLVQEESTSLTKTNNSELDVELNNDIKEPSDSPVKEELKEEFIKTKYEKLEGIKILGSIELPVIKETPKNLLLLQIILIRKKKTD